MQVDSTAAQGASGATQASGTGLIEDRTAMDKFNFLKLLIAQLQNQDPLNPADNQEFASQLAQFTSLEEMQKMNQSLQEGNDMTGSFMSYMDNNMATRYIGREVRAVGDRVHLGEDGDVQIRFHQGANSVKTVVNIYEQGGALVRTLDLGGRPAGGMDVAWDGRDQQGDRLPEGSYRFEAAAVDYNGEMVETVGFMIGLVTGVRYQDNKSYLIVGEETLAAENVLEVVMAGDK